MTCPKCKGLGEFHHINGWGGFDRLERIGCWACEGTGKLLDGTIFVSTKDLVSCYAKREGIEPEKIKVTYP
jgi:DnaJ-class molecular chaperone